VKAARFRSVIEQKNEEIEGLHREIHLFRGSVSNPEITLELNLLERRLKDAEIFGFMNNKKDRRDRDDVCFLFLFDDVVSTQQLSFS